MRCRRTGDAVPGLMFLAFMAVLVFLLKASSDEMERVDAERKAAGLRPLQRGMAKDLQIEDLRVLIREEVEAGVRAANRPEGEAKR